VPFLVKIYVSRRLARTHYTAEKNRDRTMKRSQCSLAGYTILEMLIVIAIILILIAGLFSALSKLRDRTRKGQAHTLIEKLSSAIENYNLAFRSYPPDVGPGGSTGSQALNYFLTTTFNTAPNVARGEVYANINYGPATMLEDVEKGPPTAGTIQSIVDPWKSAIVYRFENRTVKDPLTNAVSTIQVPVLYSIGVNKVDDTLPNNVPNDDISLGQ
jgi:prepilin-type N-terminal cleavage/methylation domain-containing protein